MFAPGCTGVETEPSLGSTGQEINDYVLALPDLAVADPVPKTQLGCDDECPDPEQVDDRICEYRRYTETAQYAEFIAFQPNSAALWPGSIVQGEDAQLGLFTPVGVSRAPLTFSLSLENLEAVPVGHMAQPSLSAFREERNRILAAGTTGATPASIQFEVTEIHDDSQISLALGASVLWPGGGSVSAGFDWGSSEKRTKILVNYTQAYYTIDIDTPIEPKDFFGPDVTVDELQLYTGAENPPLYVQSMTYGRRVIFSVESNASADTLKAALEAAYEASLIAEGSIKSEYKQALEESTIRAFVLGGSGAEAAGAIAGFEGLVRYITSGGDYSKDSPGAPIAYKMAYLDNSPTRFAFSTDYVERQCIGNRARMHAELVSLDHVGGGDTGPQIELRGMIGVRHPTGDSPVVDCATGGEVAYLWALEDGQWIELEELETWTPESPTYLDIDDLPVGNDQQICLFAEIWDEDYDAGEFSGDDFFGRHERLISYGSGWTGEHVLQTRGDGQNAVDVRVRVDLE